MVDHPSHAMDLIMQSSQSFGICTRTRIWLDRSKIGHDQTYLIVIAFERL
jgi:hypothetical protein